jgi:hypothetical protein
MAEKIPIDADGRFAGYASILSRLDSGGDIVQPGAFAKSLAKRRGRIRLLFQHDPKEPVGIWEELREDAHGLFAAGRLVPGVPRADALRKLIETRALVGEISAQYSRGIPRLFVFRECSRYWAKLTLSSSRGLAPQQLRFCTAMDRRNLAKMVGG